MTTDSARFSLMTPSDADDSLSTTGLMSPDYPPMSSVSSPTSLTFALGGLEEEVAVTTPLATVPGNSGLQFILEMGEKKQEQETIPEKEEPRETAHLSRIPTYDEGIADVAAEILSKDSSTGDSTMSDRKEEAAEIRKQLENLKLQQDK